MLAPLWQKTPLIYSRALSENTNASVYLKLEVRTQISQFLHISHVRFKNLQPSHSFKYRGISYFIQRAKETRGGDLHCVIASGGNAALAAACAAHILQVKCTVFIPEGVTKSTLDLLKRESAEVVVTGRFYAEALEAAKQVVATDGNA